MKILFVARSSLYQTKGGDTIQMLNTARCLRDLGVAVDIRLAAEDIDYAPYQLLHFFNIIRPADILVHIRKSGKPFVVTPIFVDYSGFDKHRRQGIPGLLFRFLPGDTIERLKTLARWIKQAEKIASPEYFLLSHRLAVQQIIAKASMLLPNSESEYRRLQHKYHTQKSYAVIPNGIDPALFARSPSFGAKSDDLVLHVGRIEGIKNQLNLIRALRNTNYTLCIIGEPAPNQAGYYEECRRLATPNIIFLGRKDQEDLMPYYCKAKVHVLASRFETTGLSSLEAAALGCNIVITEKGDTREYFGNHAFYCDPESPSSIFSAIEKAARAEVSGQLRETIYQNYTWTKAAEKTLMIYQRILGRMN